MTLHWGTANDDQRNFWTNIRISFVKLEAQPCIHENSVMQFGCFLPNDPKRDFSFHHRINYEHKE